MFPPILISKSSVETAAIFNASSKPLLEILPLFIRILLNPEDVGIGLFCNKSLVVLSYTSILPEILLFLLSKSIPRLTCSVVSHVKLGFAMLLSVMGTLVPFPGVPYSCPLIP